MEQETRVSVYWWSAKKKRPMWPHTEGERAQESPPGGVRVSVPTRLFLPHSWHSALSAASPPLPWGSQQAVADISSSVWSLSNCLLLLSTQIFIFYEAEQGCHYIWVQLTASFPIVGNLAQCLGKCPHVTTVVAEGNLPQRDMAGGPGLPRLPRDLLWASLHIGWGPVSPLFFLSFGFSGESIIS